jgi:hypothetical protein
MDLGFPTQGKGLIVQRGRAATYEDLIFRNVAVPGSNGAGVRLEGIGTTTFRRCEFRNSQEGTLGGEGPDCHVVIEDCVGDNLGAGDGLSHGVYCGTIGSLTVRGGSWTNSNIGHLLKSRASRTRIENVVLVEGRASRAIDVPNGGVVEILGCTISQSQETSNTGIIGYGLEVRAPYWPSNSFTFRATNTVTDTRSPSGNVMSFAGWFGGPTMVERYTYNGSTSNTPRIHRIARASSLGRKIVAAAQECSPLAPYARSPGISRQSRTRPAPRHWYRLTPRATFETFASGKCSRIRYHWSSLNRSMCAIMATCIMSSDPQVLIRRPRPGVR